MERAELRQILEGLPQARRRGDFIFLVDPNWSASEQASFHAIATTATKLDASRGWICIPTGGSSGRIRFARHDEVTIGAAVSGFCLHFGVERVNAVGVLPHHHVSGLMSLLRCRWTQGDYLACDWRKIASGEFPSVRRGNGKQFISVVPTQLERLTAFAEGVAFLKSFDTVFVGGGPSWSELIERAAWAAIPVAMSYGMTETAAMVCAQRPEEFSAGERSAGRTMPHATVELFDEENPPVLGVGSAGRIAIRGESVCRGYFPDLREGREWLTEDLGRIDPSGALHILGRRDAIIISGGEKIAPLEVEAAIREMNVFEDLAVLGVPDERWGEIVAVFFPHSNRHMPSLEGVRDFLGSRLAAFKLPKRLIAVRDWPRNAQGKVNRAALLGQIDT